MIDANYTILIKWVKLQHEKKPVSNLFSMQSVGFEQASTKFRDFRSARIISLEETISVAITESSNVHCLNLYLINILQNLQWQRDAQTLHPS